MNPKTLQYIMGHSDIGVTLNTYTHLQFDDAKEEMKKVCNEQWAKNLNLALNLAQTKKKLCKVIPSYTEKGKQTHYHKNIARLLKVPKIQQNQAFTEVLAT